MNIDTSNWSGEGAFTQALLDRLRHVDAIVTLRVEDSPASRSEADYNLVSNEIFVRFATRARAERVRRFGFLAGIRQVADKVMTVVDLEQFLAKIAEIGPADYSDETMLQYLRTERVVPPYQTRGYKLVELVRVYEVGPEQPARLPPPGRVRL